MATRAAFAPTGYLLFAREGMLYAQLFDSKDAKLTGDPIPLADDIRTNPTNGRAAFAVSQNGGVLVYPPTGDEDSTADVVQPGGQASGHSR